MPSYLSGPGLGLALPQNLYPSALQNAPIDNPSNRIGLAPGDELPLAAGDWYIGLGQYLVLEHLDPVLGIWTLACAAGWTSGLLHVTSDGFNLRIANRLGCPVSATVMAYGSSYVQTTTTITQVSGASVQGTWLPIVGGQLNIATTTVLTANAGAGYGMAPIVFIPPPPPAANNANGVGGIPATAYATIASGTLSGVSFTNPGAGYPSIPLAVILPNPSDPNLAVGITAATITFSLTGSGSITGALCTNPGAPLANGSLGSITLSIGGAGSSGSLTANVLQTIVSSTLSGAGTGYTTSGILTTGGVPPQGSISNGPDALYLSFRPRQPNIGLATASAATVGAIYDGGLFLGAPTIGQVAFVASGVNTATVGTIANVMGSKPDIAIIQPAP